MVVAAFSSRTGSVRPPRKNRKVQYPYDTARYKQGNVIERTFGRLKDFRRIATRFDRNVTTYFAVFCLAAAVIWRLKD